MRVGWLICFPQMPQINADLMICAARSPFAKGECVSNVGGRGIEKSFTSTSSMKFDLPADGSVFFLTLISLISFKYFLRKYLKEKISLNQCYQSLKYFSVASLLATGSKWDTSNIKPYPEGVFSGYYLIWFKPPFNISSRKRIELL